MLIETARCRPPLTLLLLPRPSIPCPAAQTGTKMPTSNKDGVVDIFDLVLVGINFIREVSINAQDDGRVGA